MDWPTHKFSITRIQIGHRYESDNFSEVDIKGKRVTYNVWNNPNGGYSFSGNFLKKNLSCSAGKTDEYNIRDIHKSDIWNIISLTSDKYFAWFHMAHEYDHGYSPSAGPRKVLYYNTYEKDGILTSNKPLSPTYIGTGVYVKLEGRMGNYDELYMFNPYAGVSVWFYDYGFRFISTDIHPATTKDYWLPKGHLRIQNTGPYCL